MKFGGDCVIFFWGGDVLWLPQKLCTTTLIALFTSTTCVTLWYCLLTCLFMVNITEWQNTCHGAKTFVGMEENNIHFMKRPPRSPDLNPIDNIWGDVKIVTITLRETLKTLNWQVITGSGSVYRPVRDTFIIEHFAKSTWLNLLRSLLCMLLYFFNVLLHDWFKLFNLKHRWMYIVL